MRRIKIIVALAVLILATMGYSVSTSAICTMTGDDADKLASLLDSTTAYDADKLSSIVYGDGTFSLFTIKVVSGKAYREIYFNNDKFDMLSAEQQNVILENFKNAVVSSSISAEGKQLLYSELTQYTDFDTSITQEIVTDIVQPDIFRGYEFLKPFSSTLSTIMGIVCIIIVISLVCSTILDLMFICFPSMRDRMEENAKNRKNGAKRPWYISYDALSACTEAETSKQYKNALGIYFKHRALSYIVLALCFTYLIGGMFIDLIYWLLDTFNKAFGWG